MIPLMVFAGVFAATVIIGLVLSPYWIADELDANVKALKERAEPRLVLQWGKEKPFRDQGHYVNDIFNRIQVIVRVCIINQSEVETIRNVQVELEDIFNYDHAYQSCPLQPMYGEDVKFDLAPEQKLYINFATWVPTQTKGKRLQLRESQMRPGSGGYSFNDASFDAEGREQINDIILFIEGNVAKRIKFGKYVVEICAYGENTHKIQKQFLLGISDDWEFVFEEASEEEVMKWLAVNT